ncbi:gspI, type II secretion system protein I [Methylophilaceae bacterium]|jgi:general secretion pathway protein I
MRKSNLGFTLIEVLVAVSIIAVSLMAASRVALNALNSSEYLKLKLSADWVAQNRLETHSIYNEWMPAGVFRGQEEQAGILLNWEEEITDTPNPAFKKVVVNVYEPSNPEYSLRRLVGFLVKPAI